MSKELSGVRGKRCLFLTNYFYPEVFRGNDIAFEMVKRGYEVTVITCIPNYPQGHFYEGYGLRSRRREVVNGVNVIRVPVIPRGDGRAIRMVLNYLSSLLFSCIYTLSIVCRKRFDFILCRNCPRHLSVYRQCLRKKYDEFLFISGYSMFGQKVWLPEV